MCGCNQNPKSIAECRQEMRAANPCGEIQMAIASTRTVLAGAETPSAGFVIPSRGSEVEALEAEIVAAKTQLATLEAKLAMIDFPYTGSEGEKYIAVPSGLYEDFMRKLKLGTAVPASDPNYYRLAEQLQAAYYQAADGKGKERHAGKNAEGQVIQPFHEQRIVMNAKVHGMGSPCGQVTKKIAEGCDMVRRGEGQRGLVEFHGAINYIAALCIAVESGVKN